jgi:hypothetical protein
MLTLSSMKSPFATSDTFFCIFAVPTPELLTCAMFQYGISNNNGLTGDDLFFERGNTFKTGLLIATENITITILNSNFPRRYLREGSNSGRLSNLFTNNEPSPTPRKSGEFGVPEYRVVHVFSLEGSSNDSLGKSVPHSLAHDEDTSSKRRTAYLPYEKTSLEVQRSMRKLVIYTEQYPITIDSIIDNTFCPGNVENPSTQCAVVSSTVCVLLEPGDDVQQVRTILVRGIQDAVQNGDFEAAIPAENQFSTP